MKRILIPTDFSQNSLSALDYVIENISNGAFEIILMWVDTTQTKDRLILDSENLSIEKAVKAQFEKILKDYAPKLGDGTLEYRIREGKVHVEVANQAKYDDVDLVVCCTHGASGFEEHYIGSNAYRIVMYCECPVITISPNYSSDSKPNIFVLPLDNSAEGVQKVPCTCKLAEITDAEIHILGLYTSKLSSHRRKVDNYVSKVEYYIADADIEFSTIFKETDNITKTILAYAESVNATLVSIMTEQESSAWNFLLGTHAERLLGASPIPVLTVTSKPITTSVIL
ncbi:MAG: universal stress protein [Bacteroidales bacterium]|jgi:nucleotide-binding universal stress UspA family protein|nr:universal stress protein [Bacteroidales bacterium]